MLEFLVIVFALATIGSFSWGLRGHFRAPDGMPKQMQALTAISGLAGVLLVVLTLRNGVDLPETLGFVVLSVLALALFWWAVDTTRRRPPHVAHSGKDPDALYEDGPYAYVRHPFYLAYCLFWVGSAVAVGGLQWVVAALLVIWYYVTSRREESQFLRSSMAPSYSEYRRRTGMILPRVYKIRRR
ncbi:isoprenylcysteine carboxylmethyltransferase family protein [Tianweitania sp. BSSL-BM11]|uniref:Isoprenylcysteine carboxylmethyltransferase family protein n=1 Tax=Tianweitania aestuarii TaxID=2814886 RepID=A0ABS5RVZ8_9HYPH|nr:isoprenylcysteine carboxylmethyltransferase family protein [Tianweitania aestuarii]MBS9721224.1 isoprenylcysteine carboxylmethyltransferase family protein [Tianweitania aestuarii]